MTIQKPSHLQLLLPGLRYAKMNAVFLKRAKKTPISDDYHQQLFHTFHWPAPQQLPIAAVAAMAESLPAHTHWLRADPVSLRVDWAQIYLLGNTQLDLTHEECQQLAAEINGYLVQENLRLWMPHPKRWYLQCPQAPHMQSHNPQDLLGKAITDYLPQDQGKYWLHLFNELQMLLQQSRVNQQRIKRQLPTVDALWLWGAGELSTVAPQPTLFTQIITDDPVVKGLGLLNQVPVTDLVNLNEAIKKISQQPGNYLIASEVIIADDIADKLFKSLKGVTTRLYPGDGYCYDLGSHSVRAWWQNLWKK